MTRHIRAGHDSVLPYRGAITPARIYSAIRLVMVAGTNVLSRGTLGAMDGLLQAFLAGTLEAGGIAVITGGLEFCGPGVALTGSVDYLDRAERAVGRRRLAGSPLAAACWAMGNAGLPPLSPITTVGPVGSRRSLKAIAPLRAIATSACMACAHG